MSLRGRVETILKKIVPEGLRRERGIMVRLGPGARGIYLRKRFITAIGISGTNEKRVPSEARSFLFVCFGNIMRSPMAEALMDRAAAAAQIDVRAESAGLHATPGKPAHPWAQTAASEMGISLSNHAAKLLTAEMIESADAVVAMDFQNLAELLNSYPQSAEKCFLLGAYATPRPLREIPDPYLGDLETTRQCYRVLGTCIQNLIASGVGGKQKHLNVP